MIYNYDVLRYMYISALLNRSSFCGSRYNELIFNNIIMLYYVPEIIIKTFVISHFCFRIIQEMAIFTRCKLQLHICINNLKEQTFVFTSCCSTSYFFHFHQYLIFPLFSVKILRMEQKILWRCVPKNFLGLSPLSIFQFFLQMSYMIST